MLYQPTSSPMITSMLGCFCAAAGSTSQAINTARPHAAASICLHNFMPLLLFHLQSISIGRLTTRGQGPSSASATRIRWLKVEKLQQSRRLLFAVWTAGSIAYQTDSYTSCRLHFFSERWPFRLGRQTAWLQDIGFSVG